MNVPFRPPHGDDCPICRDRPRMPHDPMVQGETSYAWAWNLLTGSAMFLAGTVVGLILRDLRAQ